MILIVDKTVSSRAVTLRETLYSLGCPCAVCVPNEMKSYTPFRLIMTYIDALDDVRHQPYDHVRAIVVGEGFVNSALNASQANDDLAAISASHEYLMNEMGITPDRRLPFGVIFPPSLFVSQDFIEVYGNMVPLTPTEAMIVRLLVGTSAEDRPISADSIARYCFAGSGSSPDSVPVHVSHINAKTSPHFGSPLIVSKRGCGYFSAVNTYTHNGI